MGFSPAPPRVVLTLALGDTFRSLRAGVKLRIADDGEVRHHRKHGHKLQDLLPEAFGQTKDTDGHRERSCDRLIGSAATRGKQKQILAWNSVKCMLAGWQAG